MEFSSEILEIQQSIEEDCFLTNYLWLTEDFKYVSCCVYLEMIVFEDNKKIIIYDEFAKIGG